MIRVGAVPYTNGAPLVYGLEDISDVRLIKAVPSRLAQMLKDEELDVGLVSSAATFTNPHLEIVPEISISSRGPAQSVKMFFKDRLEYATTVALDTSSLTSVLLAQIVLKECYHVCPQFISMPPSVDQMLGRCDAAVLIGDTAMSVPEGKWPYVDLGEVWHDLTGLPFTFAVWAARPNAPAEILDLLLNAKKRGLLNLASISKVESKRLGLDYELCYKYLSEVMNYDLTEEHIAGLDLFRRKALMHGFISDAFELRFFEPLRSYEVDN